MAPQLKKADGVAARNVDARQRQSKIPTAERGHVVPLAGVGDPES
jgi:hypothetical protein